MKNLISALLLVMTGVLCNLEPSAAEGPAKTMTLAVGTATVGYFKAITPEFEKETGFKIQLLHEAGLSADSALVAVDRGTAEAAIAGIDWEGWKGLLKIRGISFKNEAQASHQTIGKESISIVTFKGGPGELSDAHVKGLLTGKITNWKAVNGKDLPVQIAIMANANATQKAVIDRALGGEDIFRSGIKILPGPKELSQFIGSTPGAIGFAPSKLDASEVNRPKHEAITRPIEIMYLGEKGPGLKLLLEYIAKHPLS